MTQGPGHELRKNLVIKAGSEFEAFIPFNEAALGQTATAQIRRWANGPLVAVLHTEVLPLSKQVRLWLTAIETRSIRYNEGDWELDVVGEFGTLTVASGRAVVKADIVEGPRVPPGNPQTPDAGRIETVAGAQAKVDAVLAQLRSELSAAAASLEEGAQAEVDALEDQIEAELLDYVQLDNAALTNQRVPRDDSVSIEKLAADVKNLIASKALQASVDAAIAALKTQLETELAGKAPKGDIVADDPEKGVSIAGLNGHYWRVTIDTDGAILTDDLGATRPVMPVVTPTINDVGDDVVLLVGQSNMVGYGSGLDTTYLDPPDPRIKQYPGSGSYLGKVVTAIDPLFHTEQFAGGVGLAMSFAREYVRTMSSSRRLLFVPCARGNTGFRTSSVVPTPSGYEANVGTWEVGGAGVNFYEFAIAQANAAIALNPANRLVAILWHQGEKDTFFLNEAQYAAQLDALIAGFRSRISTASATTPFILGQMVPTYAGGAYKAAVEAAHIRTQSRNIRTAFVYGPSGSSYVNSDGVHWNAAGQRILGSRYFEALTLARANMLGAAPTAPGAPVISPFGTSMAVTWARPTSRVTDYSIQYRVTGAGSWTTVAHTATPDCNITISGLSEGTSYEVRVAAVNEAGTSPWSPTTPATTYVRPAQVTGVTVGTPTATSIPLSWTINLLAASYLMEYRVTGSGGSWTSGGTSTATSATIAGLAPYTQYDVRVSAVNPAGTGLPSSVATATTPALPRLFTDVGVAAHRAYGLRKLNAAYSGYACKVVRSTDLATMDVGFTGGGDLDTAPVLAWAGAATVTISDLYDQSGNARHVSQPTVSKQATLITAGVLNTLNGKPVWTLNGTSAYYLDTTGANLTLFSSGASSVLAVLVPTSASTGLVLAEGTISGTAGAIYSPLYMTARAPSYTLRNNAGTQWAQGTGSVAIPSTGGQVSVVDTGSSIAAWVGGVPSVSATAYSRSGQSVTPTAFILGAVYQATPATFYGGSAGEIVVYATPLTTSQRLAGESNQRAYWGV